MNLGTGLPTLSSALFTLLTPADLGDTTVTTLHTSGV